MSGVLRRRADGCANHRLALLGLLDDPLGRQLDPASRGHLERCAACRIEISEAVLTSRAVRSSFGPATAAVPSADAWPRLRDRVLRGRGIRRVGRAASPLLGLALSAGLAVALLLPLGVNDAGVEVMHEAGVVPAAIRAAGDRDAQDEVRQLRATMLAGKEAASDDADNRARVALIRYEAAPVPDWRVPTRSPLSAAAQ